MDFALSGGWHVTLFQPWGWILIVAVALLGCALLAKFFLYGITRW